MKGKNDRLLSFQCKKKINESFETYLRHKYSYAIKLVRIVQPVHSHYWHELRSNYLVILSSFVCTQAADRLPVARPVV